MRPFTQIPTSSWSTAALLACKPRYECQAPPFFFFTFHPSPFTPFPIRNFPAFPTYISYLLASSGFPRARRRQNTLPLLSMPSCPHSLFFLLRHHHSLYSLLLLPFNPSTHIKNSSVLQPILASPSFKHLAPIRDIPS